jgi:formylglycine-generating enzyme required for sulfatase activity
VLVRPQGPKEKKLVVDGEDKADSVGVNSNESRVLRGGSWFIDNCRAAVRYWFEPVVRFRDFGFRVARSVASRTP